jgi:hypothetical protein
MVNCRRARRRERIAMVRFQSTMLEYWKIVGFVQLFVDKYRESPIYEQKRR